MNTAILETPFIPVKHVRLIAIDARAPEYILNKLASMGIDLIPVEPCENIHSAVSGHPDILLHPLKNQKILVAPNAPYELVSKLENFGFITIPGHSFLKSNYPEDIAYNVARIGEVCFHKLKHTDPVLKKNLLEDGLTLINVKQGYSKCSVAILNNRTIITSDKGIHTSALENQIESLLISPGYIELKGHDYGFIGGCTGLIGPGVLAVTGSLNSHPDHDRIETFVRKHQIDLVYLSEKRPVDLGSLIPLIEDG